MRVLELVAVMDGVAPSDSVAVGEHVVVCELDMVLDGPRYENRRENVEVGVRVDEGENVAVPD